MAVKTEKGSEVKDFTTDPVDSDKLLGFKNSDGTRWWSLSRFWNWIKSKTASTITAGDKTPVNSDAVNGALTNLTSILRIAINSDTELENWFKDNPYRQALLYLHYDSTILGLSAGEFLIYGSRDAGIVKGEYTETYGRSAKYFIEFQMNPFALRTKEQIALKNELPIGDSIWGRGWLQIGKIKIAWGQAQAQGVGATATTIVPIQFVHIAYFGCTAYYNNSPDNKVYSVWTNDNKTLNAKVDSYGGDNTFSFIAIGY